MLINCYLELSKLNVLVLFYTVTYVSAIQIIHIAKLQFYCHYFFLLFYKFACVLGEAITGKGCSFFFHRHLASILGMFSLFLFFFIKDEFNYPFIPRVVNSNLFIQFNHFFTSLCQHVTTQLFCNEWCIFILDT